VHYDDAAEFRDADVVGFSATTGVHREALAIASRLKTASKAVIVMGGPHPTFFPDVVERPEIDYVFRGEAESCFPAFLDSYPDLPDERVVFCSPQDLTAIPWPDREELYKYDAHRNNPIKNIMCSRGCAFAARKSLDGTYTGCSYCYAGSFYHIFGGKPVRWRDPDDILAETEYLVGHWPVKMIFFQDDSFLSMPRVEDFLEAYASRVGVPFHAQMRVESVTKEKLLALKEAGCRSITMALESGSERVRKEILNRHMSNESVIEACRLIREVGLRFRIENMVGIPGETLEEMVSTLDVNIKLRPTIGWASIYTPYPNTPLAEKARRDGLWDGTVDNFYDSFFDESVMDIPHAREASVIQKLFSIVTWQPWLRGIAIFLMRHTRPSWLYKVLYRVVKKHLYRRGLYGV